jgi:hypothetical protein
MFHALKNICLSDKYSGKMVKFVKFFD